MRITRTFIFTALGILLAIACASCVGSQSGYDSTQGGFQVTDGDGNKYLTRKIILYAVQGSARSRVPLDAKEAMKYSSGEFRNGEFKALTGPATQISFITINGLSMFLDGEWHVRVVPEDWFTG